MAYNSTAPLSQRPMAGDFKPYQHSSSYKSEVYDSHEKYKNGDLSRRNSYSQQSSPNKPYKFHGHQRTWTYGDQDEALEQDLFNLGLIPGHSEFSSAGHEPWGADGQNGSSDVNDENDEEKHAQTDLQKEVETLKAELAKYKNQVSKVKETERYHENERKKWQDEKQKLETQMQRQATKDEHDILKVESLQKKLDEANVVRKTLAEQTENLKKTHDKKEKAIREEYDKKLEKLTLEYEKKIQDITQGPTQTSNMSLKESESLNKQYQDKMQKKESEHKTKLEELKKECEENVQIIRSQCDEKIGKLNELIGQYDDKITKLTHEYEAKIKELERQNDENMGRLALKATEIREMEESQNEMKKHEREKNDQHQKEIKAIKSEAELEIRRIREECDEKIKLMKQRSDQEHGSKEEELKKAHGEKIQEIRDRYDEKVKDLTKEHKAKMAEIEGNHRREIKATRREGERNVERIKEEYEEKIRRLQKEIEEQRPPKEWVVPENIYNDDRLKTILHQIMDKVDDSISICPRPSSSIDLSHRGRVLLPVLAAGRLGNDHDVQQSMEKAELGSVPVIVLIFHHRALHNSKITATKDRLSDRELVERSQDMIDLVFWNGALYECPANQKALSQLKTIAKEAFRSQ